ncbi:hypothetical protein GFB56_17555 [Ensifer sp. T173]|uniref:Uncharacterized protein n=1 Tax=Ensifer canadensis TaxID=555315 RepID=A0AAW4FNF4_9HYPH|nr:hypothetical protein [Ensifer canadensis]
MRSWRSFRPDPIFSGLLHVSLSPIRFRDKNMQQFKVLQRPLRVQSDAPRCRRLDLPVS